MKQSKSFRVEVSDCFSVLLFGKGWSSCRKLQMKKDLEEWQKELSKKEWFIKLQKEKVMDHYNVSDTKQQN